MEHFCVAYQTDIGIKKKNNQDSLLLKGAQLDSQEVLLAVLCDGMGGMDKGELASATVIRAFDKWFSNTCVQADTEESAEVIQHQWMELLKQENHKLIQYGESHQVQLGTTATSILIFSNGTYHIGHVGDTRAYQITKHFNYIKQLTEDHTFVAREVKRGNMTEEQARRDKRKNILLQCIGVEQQFSPQFLNGKISKDDELLLCSDGFRHVVTEEEILSYLSSDVDFNEDEMNKSLRELVNLNMQRKETDNISAILIKLL